MSDEHAILRSSPGAMTFRCAFEAMDQPLNGSGLDLQKAVEQHESPVHLPSPDAQGANYLPGVRPENLGDASFAASHKIRFPYVCGEMANGIATVEMVAESARSGWLGFFGAAGCSLDRIEQAIV